MMESDILRAVTIGDILGLLAFVSGAIAAVKSVLNQTKKAREKLLAPVMKELHQKDLHIWRLEILLLINTQPGKAENIEHAYDEYCALGGNSYVHQVVKEWRSLYERDVIRQRLEHST
jgi:hypothetical protein